jgi:hypothetical protein
MSTRKKLAIFFIGNLCCFFTGIAIDLACGPEIDPYDYYVSFFHNDLSGNQTYSPFYFTRYEFLYDNREQLSETAVNAREWAAYLGGKVKAEDAETAMYDLGDYTDSVLLKGYLNLREQLPDDVKNNTFLQSLIQPDHKQALKYYIFAKSKEPYILGAHHNEWNPKPLDSVAIQKAGIAALQMGKAENDKFLKLRYYYLAQRSMHYAGHYADASDIYDKHIANYLSKSHVKGWALALKAGEERRLGNKNRAAYLFAKVFEKYPERRLQAYKNYSYIKAPVQDVIKLAANNNERAFIYAIDGFNTPDISLTALQKVYQYQPASPLIKVLLIREINKVEDNYLTVKLNKSFPFANDQYPYMDPTIKAKKYARHIEKLKEFCGRLSTGNKYPKPALAQLAIAYLSWMENKNGDGFTALKAFENEQSDQFLFEQKQIIKLLLESQKININHKVDENELLPLLTWLDRKAKADLKNRTGKVVLNGDTLDAQNFSTSSRDFYQMVLAPAYLRLGDTAKAALAVLKSDAYQRNDQQGDYKVEPWRNGLDFWPDYLTAGKLKEIIYWKHHLPGNAYLKFLAHDLKKLSDNNLYDLLGTLYLREHAYTKAIFYLKKRLPEPKTQQYGSFYIDEDNQADPFIEALNDYPKTAAAPGSKLYTKLKFATEMARLERLAKTDHKNAYRYYYLAATGLYNTSFSGNSWYLISYEWQNYDYQRTYKYIYDDDYLKSFTAEKYYLKARQAGGDPEFKAKCIFMAAKCRQKQIPIPGDYDYEAPGEKYERAVRLNPYFKTLRHTYSKTAFYKLAVHDCSYLRDFLASKNK